MKTRKNKTMEDTYIFVQLQNTFLDEEGDTTFLLEEREAYQAALMLSDSPYDRSKFYVGKLPTEKIVKILEKTKGQEIYCSPMYCNRPFAPEGLDIITDDGKQVHIW